VWQFNDLGTSIIGTLWQWEDYWSDSEHDDPLSFYPLPRSYYFELNPEVDEEGAISFTTAFTEVTVSSMIVAIDWERIGARLVDTEDEYTIPDLTIKYVQIARKLQSPVTQTGTLEVQELGFYRQDASITKYSSLLGLREYSIDDVDNYINFGIKQSVSQLSITGLDLRADAVQATGTYIPYAVNKELGLANYLERDDIEVNVVPSLSQDGTPDTALAGYQKDDPALGWYTYDSHDKAFRAYEALRYIGTTPTELGGVAGSGTLDAQFNAYGGKDTDLIQYGTIALTHKDVWLEHFPTVDLTGALMNTGMAIHGDKV